MVNILVVAMGVYMLSPIGGVSKLDFGTRLALLLVIAANAVYAINKFWLQNGVLEPAAVIAMGVGACLFTYKLFLSRKKAN